MNGTFNRFLLLIGGCPRAMVENQMRSFEKVPVLLIRKARQFN
jgi:hypothetical protein